jgi:predicted phage-related endonuclease
MQVLNLIQGSEAWHAARNDTTVVGTASEAPAMMGASKYQTRDELLKVKATGIKPEVDSYKQKIFDSGHAAEAKARPIVEAMLGEELYPVTCINTVDGIKLLASLDGLTMDQKLIWENKILNGSLAADVKTNDLGPHYYWQLEHQLAVTGADLVYFTTSDGTEDQTYGCDYKSVPERRERLIAGWKQFAQDLAAYAPQAEVVKVVGHAPESLPALRVEVAGMVTASNIAEFKATALGAIQSVNLDPKTDQDFADNTKAIKWCSEIESRVKAAKANAQAQTTDINELYLALDEIATEARKKRLALEAADSKNKKTIKDEIVSNALASLIAHCNALNHKLGRPLMPVIPSDFEEAIKGKRSVETQNAAANNELARAKVEASLMYGRIAANIALPEITEYPFLFNDLAAICTKPAEDFAAAVRLRVGDHLAAEEARLDRERETIRKEELAKIEAAAAAKVVPVEIPVSNAPTVLVIDEAHTVISRAPVIGLTATPLLQDTSHPTDDQIVQALCRVYGADRRTVVAWLCGMNLQALQLAA